MDNIPTRSVFFGCVLSLFLMLSLCNTVFLYPVDKVAFFIFCSVAAFGLRGNLRFGSAEFMIVLMSAIFFISYFGSLDELSLFKFDSLIVVYFSFCTLLITPILRSNYVLVLRVFIGASFAYLVFGILAWAYSVQSGEIFFVQPLYGKQMADVYAALSFSTTQQVLGTIAALNFVSVFWLKKNKLIGPWCWVLFMVSLIAIISSLNRVWLIFVPFLLLLWLGKKAVYSFLLALLIAIPVFIFYSDVMFSFGTVSSRFSMIQKIFDFWVAQDFRYILIGRPFYSGDYFFMDGSMFSYVESGPFYLLVKFGLLGFFFYSVVSFACVVFLARLSIFLSFFLSYYLVFVQFMTHEFFSVSFWLFCCVCFCLHRLEERAAHG